MLVYAAQAAVGDLRHRRSLQSETAWASATKHFSLITEGDAHIAPHDMYQPVAVGGTLYDAGCGNKPMGSKYGQAPNYGSQYNCINNGIGGVQGCSSSFGGGSFFGRRLEDGTQAADEAAADNSTDDGEGVTARHRRRLFEVPYSINSGMCQNQNSQCNAWQWKGPQDGFYYTGCFSDLYTWSEFENFACSMYTTGNGLWSSGQYYVKVVDQGGFYDPTGLGPSYDDGSQYKSYTSSGMYTSESNGQPGKGCMLVFKGAGTVGIDRAGQNDIFGCGVLAPFATVLQLGDSTYKQNLHVEFTIVAKTYLATGQYANSAQLHGYVYGGDWPGAANPGDTCSGRDDDGAPFPPSPPPPPPPDPPPPPPNPPPPSPPPECTPDGVDVYVATGDGAATPCCDNTEPCREERGADDPTYPNPDAGSRYIFRCMGSVGCSPPPSPPPPSPEPPAVPPPGEPPASPTPSMPPAVPTESPQTPPPPPGEPAPSPPPPGSPPPPPEPSPPPPHPDAPPGTPTSFKCQCTFASKCTCLSQDDTLGDAETMARVREHYGFADTVDPIATRCAGTDDVATTPHLGLQAGDPMLGDCYSIKSCQANAACAALGLGGNCCPTDDGQTLSCCDDQGSSSSLFG